MVIQNVVLQTPRFTLNIGPRSPFLNAQRRVLPCVRFIPQSTSISEKRQTRWIKASAQSGGSQGSSATDAAEEIAPFGAKVVTEENWDDEVLKSPVPVFVDFWAPWCGPCRMLGPTIDELIGEFGDKFKAVKINTDKSPSIATEYGIRSIPTCMVFKNGKKVESVIGAVKKQVLKNSIEKHLVHLPLDARFEISFSPLEDRLHALTAPSGSDFDLPEVQGVHLIKTGDDAGLYQITLLGNDGNTISLGRADGIDKASQIHDMIAIALYGRHYPLNFSPKKYTIELFIDVLLTFQKLFPGESFWNAMERGMNAGVSVNIQQRKNHPVLDAYYKYQTRKVAELGHTQTSLLRTKSVRKVNQSVAEWPPFCPPWMLPTHPLITQDAMTTPRRKKLKRRNDCFKQSIACSTSSAFEGFPSWCDGAVTVVGIDQKKPNTFKECSMTSGSMETLSQEHDEVSSGFYHVTNTPTNGVVQRRVNEAFVPPKPVVEYDFMNLSGRTISNGELDCFASYSRRTRRGRSVRQPARYREDSIQFSDSDHGDENPSGNKSKRIVQGNFQTPVETKKECRINGSKHVVKLPHVQPMPKVEAAAVVEDSNCLVTEAYRQLSSSHLYHPFLKIIPSRNQ
eukprot:g6769.t1